MTGNVFRINGHKIYSMLIDKESLKFLGKNAGSPEEFIKSWDNRFFLGNKQEIALAAIRIITKELQSSDIVIEYDETGFGYNETYRFSFEGGTNSADFFEYLVQQKNFEETVRQLKPNEAVKQSVVIFFISAAIFAVWYVLALGISSRVISRSRSGKGRLFEDITSLLGANGILIAGVLVLLVCAYRIYVRYQNPPEAIILQPRIGKPAS